MAITDAVLNELLKDYQKPEDLLGKDGLLKQLQKRLLERAMDAELTVHLGYDKHDAAGDNSGNSRNGTTPKPSRESSGNWRWIRRGIATGPLSPRSWPKGNVVLRVSTRLF